MPNIYTEENGVYCIDCTNAIWSTDRIHDVYHESGLMLSDVDFVIEDTDSLLLVEYKNSTISNAAQPGSFRPEQENMILKVSRKYYDSLHFLTLAGKNKPKRFVYIVECLHGDAVLRKRIRLQLKSKLPFRLQEMASDTEKLIEDVDVLSIDEWNNDSLYGKYPILPIRST